MGWVGPQGEEQDIGDMKWEMGRDSKQGGGRPIQEERGQITPRWFDNQGIIFYICLKLYKMYISIHTHLKRS